MLFRINHQSLVILDSYGITIEFCNMASELQSPAPKKGRYMKKLILIDDDSLIHSSFKALFADTSIDVMSFSSGVEAVQFVSKNPKDFPVILIDYHLTDTDEEKGSHYITLFKNLNPEVIVFMFSGDLDRDTLKDAMKSGAKDFFEKGTDLEQTRKHIVDAFDRYSRKTSLSDTLPTKEENQKLIKSMGLIGQSNEMVEVIQEAKMAASHQYTVLLLGESGTGKEMLARSIAKSFSGDYVAVNCATFKDDLSLMESEFFGHEKGAFTGADKRKIGLFEQASGGVIFLDEVHELSMPAQLRLLRVLQEKKIRRVGGNTEIPLGEVKIIAAAKPDLKEKVDRGEFYIDLYTRLCVFPIEIPALRRRIDDIDVLVSFFCDKYSRENGLDKKFKVSALEKLKRMEWKGNVRELEHLVLRLVITSKGSEIGPEDISISTDETPTNVENVSTLKELKQSFEAMERDLIVRVLEKSERNQSEAAQKLGIPLSTLQLRLKKHNIFHAYTKRSDAGTRRRH